MKRVDLIRHLIKNGCVFLREGTKHSVFFNPLIKRSSTVSRHKDVDNFLAEKICRDLGVQEVKK